MPGQYDGRRPVVDAVRAVDQFARPLFVPPDELALQRVEFAESLLRCQVVIADAFIGRVAQPRLASRMKKALVPRDPPERIQGSESREELLS